MVRLCRALAARSSVAAVGVDHLISDWSALVARSSWRDYEAASAGMSTGMSGRTNKVLETKSSSRTGGKTGVPIIGGRPG